MAIPDERLSGQQPEGHPPGGREGRHHGHAARVWTLDRDTPYVPSPLLYDGILYFLKSNNGLLSAFDAKTGTPHYQLQRLDETPEVFASPVGAAGRVYITGRDGKTVVLKHGNDVRGARRQHARRRLRRVAGAGGQRDVPAGVQVSVLLERENRCLTARA